VNDPRLYNNLNALLARFDTLTSDLKAHPGKYVNVHIF
jgi:hypothetical protein